MLPDICKNINLATTNRPRNPNTKLSITSNSSFKTSGSIPSDPGEETVALTLSDMKPEDMVKLNGSTLEGSIEGGVSAADNAGKDDNLFKSKLVQSTGIPHLDVLKSSNSKEELKPHVSPSLGADVYPSKPHDGLSENTSTHTERNWMTNSDAEQLKRFLQAENTYEGKILCPKCLKRKCQDCSLLNNKYSQEEKDVFQRMWNNIVLIKDNNGSYKVKVNYLYKSDPNIIFSPENTNYNQALMMTKKVIQQLKKKGQLEMFQKEIEKKNQHWDVGGNE